MRARFVPALVAIAACVAGCGGGSDGGARPASATSSPGLSDPEQQAANIVPAVTKLDVWTARLRSEWGATPTARWSAVREADARWRAQLVLRGPKSDQRLTASWLVLLPLDRAPAVFELEGDASEDVRPRDAGARRLSALPPALASERTVTVVADLVPRDDGVVAQLDSVGAGEPSIRNGVLDEASLRGALLVRSATARDVVRLDRGGVRVTESGRPLDRAALRERARSGTPIVVKITWRDVPTGETRASLLRRRPALVEVRDLSS